MTQQYDEADALAREAIRHRGDLTGANRVLTVSAAMSGDTQTAAAALAELAAPSREFPFRGSRPSCHGAATPTGSTSWKGSGGRTDLKG